MKVLILGAGKIGRGFLAHLFARAGWCVVFVDQSEKLVAELKRRDSYFIRLAAGDGRIETFTVSGFGALHTSELERINREIRDADLLALAVQPADLGNAAELLAPGIFQRLAELPGDLNLIVCANIPGASSVLRRHLEELWGRIRKPSLDRQDWLGRLGLVDSIVIRTIPEPASELLAEDPLGLLATDYPDLYLNRSAFLGQFPGIPGLVALERFHEHEIRKLYTYNMVHALLGFLGWAEGYEYLVDSIKDPWIRRQAESALEEATAGLIGEFGFAAMQMQEWNEGVFRLMENPYIVDRVERMVKEPRRKLGRNERLTGPALLALKHGKRPKALSRVIAHALHFLGVSLNETAAACQLEEADSELLAMLRESYSWISAEKKAAELGFAYEKTYKGCGQCAFAAIQEALGKSEDRVFQALTPFAGGLGLAGDCVCSALIGAAACFGLASGRRRAHFGGDREQKYASFAMAQELRERYLTKYGTLICHGVQERILGRSFDLRDSQERERFEQAGAHVDKCTQVVSDVVRWSMQILAERG